MLWSLHYILLTVALFGHIVISLWKLILIFSLLQDLSLLKNGTFYFSLHLERGYFGAVFTDDSLELEFILLDRSILQMVN